MRLVFGEDGILVPKYGVIFYSDVHSNSSSFDMVNSCDVLL